MNLQPLVNVLVLVILVVLVIWVLHHLLAV